MTVFMQLITASIIIGMLVGTIIGTIVFQVNKRREQSEMEFWEELERRHLDRSRNAR